MEYISARRNVGRAQMNSRWRKTAVGPFGLAKASGQYVNQYLAAGQ
ncbi:hypothetical protein SAMN05518801_101262 [Novosphingobium sp. CF614]|nr:hypothetical protein [Novosphingobium sp. CF614]SFF75448.1 hypothetical protein SAMN05518801_101262 [Novosphingobium sp. CF614]